jgi:hypothetical protein
MNAWAMLCAACAPHPDRRGYARSRIESNDPFRYSARRVFVDEKRLHYPAAWRSASGGGTVPRCV